MMNRQHGRKVDERRKRDTRNIVEVQQIDRFGRVADSPAAMIGILQLRRGAIGQRPLGACIPPFDVTGETRFAVSIHGDFKTSIVEVTSKIPNEKLCAAVPTRWNFDKRGSD